MKYAIIRLGGKQLKVAENDTFEIECQENPINVEVLAYVDNETSIVGSPVLTNVTVELSIVKDIRDEKVRVARFKAKSRYKKLKGHKQPLSVIKVEKISFTGESK